LIQPSCPSSNFSKIKQTNGSEWKNVEGALSVLLALVAFALTMLFKKCVHWYEKTSVHHHQEPSSCSRLNANPTLPLHTLFPQTCKRNYTMKAQDVWDFANVLEHSDCASRFMSLWFDQCELSGEGVRAFAGLLSQGALPALKELDFQANGGIGDECGVALAEALL
jgi:hypothetical protein